MNAKVLLVFASVAFSAPTVSEAVIPIGMPSSNLVISGEVITSEKSFRFCAREGSMLILRTSQGNSFGIILRTQPETEKLRVFKFQLSGEDGREGVTQLDPDIKLEISPASTIELIQAPERVSMRIELRGEFEFSTKPLDQTRLGLDATTLEKAYRNDRCCVSCGGATACASFIGLGCGNCSSFGHSTLKGCQ